MANDKRNTEAVRPRKASRTGSITLVLLIAVVLVGAALFLTMIGRDQAQPYILLLLAVLAVVGIFSLFAGAAGILRFSTSDASQEVTAPLVDGSPIGAAAVDRNGHVLYANAAYLTLTGATSARDVRGIERVFTSDPDISEAVYRLAQAGREGRAWQEEVRHATGETARWLRLKVRPLASTEDANAPQGAVVWNVEDITRERERAETAFESLQKAIDFLDHAPAGFFSAQADGAVTHMNATLADWLGYDLAEVGTGGMSLASLFAGDGASLFRSLAVKPGEVVSTALDVDMKRSDGQSLPVRLYHKVSYSPDGTAGASRTIVVKAERDSVDGAGLRAAEARFARFFNNSPLGIAIVDASGVSSRANPAYLRLAGELAGGKEPSGSVLDLVDATSRPVLQAALANAAAGKADIAPCEIELAATPRRYARAYVAPAVDAQAPGEAALVYLVETTEQRLLQEQFAQSHKMQAIGQLAGGVAHDFNNVLQVIVGNADLLLMNHRPGDPAYNDIMQIKQNANRGASLVRQLLAFSRKQTMRPQVVQLGDVISDMTMMLKRSLGERVTCEMDHARDLWPVMADITQLEQVVLNLAVNARDAMLPKGGKLTIRTANVAETDLARHVTKDQPKDLPAADYVRVDVTDTGSGIPEDIRQKIFEPFFSTKDVGQGTGLGLSTVYGIIKQSNGFIFVDSKMGEGTTFRIFLPRFKPEQKQAQAELAAPNTDPATARIENVAAALAGGAAATGAAAVAANGAAGTPATPTPAAPPRNDTGGETILLVEDEAPVRAFGARALSSRGYTVLEAGSGVEALEVLAEHDGTIDLVVSDVVMPEMNGPTLLRELRKTHPETRFIFVSGYAEDAFANDLPAGENFRFLPKPFSLKQLIETVKDTLES